MCLPKVIYHSEKHEEGRYARMILTKRMGKWEKCEIHIWNYSSSFILIRNLAHEIIHWSFLFFPEVLMWKCHKVHDKIEGLLQRYTSRKTLLVYYELKKEKRRLAKLRKQIRELEQKSE